MKLNLAATNVRHRIRCISESSLTEPEFNKATTAVLSEWKQIDEPCHVLPHNNAAMTIGAISFAEMCQSSSVGGH